MDEEMIENIQKCHRMIDNIEREMHKLREENIRLRIENENLKQKYESTSHLNQILLTKDK